MQPTLTPAPTAAVRPTRPRGYVDAVPLVLGYLPFGLVLGATTAASPLPTWLGLLLSPLIFAGAAQLALVDVLGSGGAVLTVVLTALAINLRHVLYSTDLSPWFRDSPTWWRWAAPVVLTDPQYLLTDRRFPELADEATRRRWYVELGVTLWTAWTAMTAVGVLLGDLLPDTALLDMAVPLTFLALLVPTLDDRPALGAATVGGAVAVAAHGLPLHLGLLVGAIAGMVAGLVLEDEDNDLEDDDA